jgi:hypothetical protein
MWVVKLKSTKKQMPESSLPSSLSLTAGHRLIKTRYPASPSTGGEQRYPQKATLDSHLPGDDARGIDINKCY